MYADLAIWLLLALGVGFGLLGFFGLLIFPDIRSRHFTASRATLIAASVVLLSAIIFSLAAFAGGRGDIYATFAIHAIFLFGIIIIGNLFVSRFILDRVPVSSCRPEESAASPEKNR
jgi:multisubunit Na+/H+ antiporter MnhG subunit